MKLLVLGAKGNLGNQLVKVFSVKTPEKEYEIIAWDREEIDICDKELIIKKISELKPAIIINAAAYNSVDKCEEDEEQFKLAKKINGEAVGYLAQAARSIGSILVHYSTNYVFSGENTNGYKEDEKPNPINKYGESKLLGEQELLKEAGFGLKYYLIRTSKLFGYHGESENNKPSFFDLMISLSKSHDELKAVDEEISCFTYTPDLAQATKDLIEKEVRYGIYHLTNVGRATWYEAAVELFKALNDDIKIIPVSGSEFPRPAKRPMSSVLLNTKLDWLRPWQEALREYLSIKF